MATLSSPVTNWTQLPVSYGNDRLAVGPFMVMMDWEKDLMEAMAHLLCAHTRGEILEVGFGLGLSATEIQKRSPSKHVIVEAHPDVARRSHLWKQTYAGGAIEIVEQSWQKVVDSLPKFDGIFFDPYAENETLANIEKHEFLTIASQRLLTAEGALTFFHLSPRINNDLQALLYSYYSSVEIRPIALKIPAGYFCPEMYGENYALAILAKK